MFTNCRILDILEMPVFEEVRGGFMATIKREKFMAIQKGHNITSVTQKMTQKNCLSVNPCGILFDLLVTVYSLQNQPQMIFNDSFIVSNILHLNQSTLTLFMIANKKADGIISTQIALTV